VTVGPVKTVTLGAEGFVAVVRYVGRRDTGGTGNLAAKAFAQGGCHLLLFGKELRLI
jgi:hypothetical protein